MQIVVSKKPHGQALFHALIDYLLTLLFLGHLYFYYYESDLSVHYFYPIAAAGQCTRPTQLMALFQKKRPAY